MGDVQTTWKIYMEKNELNVKHPAQNTQNGNQVDMGERWKTEHKLEV